MKALRSRFNGVNLHTTYTEGPVSLHTCIFPQAMQCMWWFFLTRHASFFRCKGSCFFSSHLLFPWVSTKKNRVGSIVFTLLANSGLHPHEAHWGPAQRKSCTDSGCHCGAAGGYRPAHLSNVGFYTPRIQYSISIYTSLRNTSIWPIIRWWVFLSDLLCNV